MADKPKASLASLMKDAKANKINNAGGGHYNHCMFWEIMSPNAGGAPTGAVAEQINKARLSSGFDAECTCSLRNRDTELGSSAS